MSFTRQTAIILRKVWVETEGTFNPQTTECRYRAVLLSLTDIAWSETAYSNLVVIDCKLAYCVEIVLRLGGAVCRQRLNCGWELFLQSWQYLKSQIALCQAVYGERQNSNLSLYCTAHYSADSATVAPFLYKLCSYSHYLCALLPTVHYSKICTINTTTHSCWTVIMP